MTIEEIESLIEIAIIHNNVDKKSASITAKLMYKKHLEDELNVLMSIDREIALSQEKGRKYLLNKTFSIEFELKELNKD